MGTTTPPERTQLAEIDDRRRIPDRRGSPRRKFLKAGRTFWPNGDSSECTVYNLSEAGAQLELRGPAPNRFDLVVDGDRWRRCCTVIWRRANRVGVTFQDQPHLLPAKPANPLVHCRRYADECQKLAERATLPDRKLLLEMSEAWITIARRLRRNGR